MTISPRSLVTDFSMANPIYAGATINFFTVDSGGMATTTLATLYAGLTGSAVLANPQILDSEGKFTFPVYIDVPVIASVSNSGVDDHSTGIVVPTGIWRGVWAVANSYQIGQIVSSGSSVYISTQTHTSSLANSPLVAPTVWETIVDFSIAASDAVTAINLTTGVGDGTAAALTLTTSPAFEENVLFYIGGVRQDTTTYTVDGAGHLTPGGAVPIGVPWEALSFSSVSAISPVNASLVNVSPTVAGASNAQSAISAINSAASSAQSDAATALSNAATALSTANAAGVTATAAGVTATAAQITANDAYSEATSPIVFADLAASIIASQPQAETGSATDVLMTPQRVAQAISVLAAASSTGRFIGYRIFTASGSYTKATNNPTSVLAFVVGGGGSGYKGSTNRYINGGAAGGMSIKRILASALSASETVTVGAGGAAQTSSNANGIAGGSSSFGAHCSATGGSYGTGSATPIAPTVGGVGSGGDLNLRGESGGAGLDFSEGGGTTQVVITGRGARGFLGAGVAGSTVGISGPSATANSGGGGAGGYAASSGAGGSGIVIIMEFS